MAKPIEIVVGSVGGPVAGQSTWATSQFAGLAGYLERQGEGTLQQSVYTVDQDGITLLGGAQFAVDEVYFFHPTNVSLVTDSGNYTNGFDYNRVIRPADSCRPSSSKHSIQGSRFIKCNKRNVRTKSMDYAFLPTETVNRLY